MPDNHEPETRGTDAMGPATHVGRQVIPLHPERAMATTQHLGMVIFLSSWAMMFGALFYAYMMLRIRAVSWPLPGMPELPVLLPSINTAILLTSSAALVWGQRALRNRRETPFRRWMITAMTLGIVFLLLQVQLWTDLWASGLRPSSGPYGSIVFFLTAFHAIHVAIGLCVLLWQLLLALRTPPGLQRQNRVRLAGMFWHFVDAVWFLMFVLMFLF